MKKIVLATTICLAVFLGAAGARADTLINFDNVTNGTIINTAYAGVTFSCHGAACPSGNVYARSAVGAFSSPNVVSTEPNPIVPFQQDASTGAIEVAFATPQSAVSIEAEPTLMPEGFGTSGYAYLQAYDSSLHLLGQVNDSTLNVYSLLSESFAGDISYLLIGETTGNFPTIALFDNLCYSTDTTGCGAGGGGGSTSTPEPGSFLLLGTGLVVLVLGSRLRKGLLATS